MQPNSIAVGDLKNAMPCALLLSSFAALPSFAAALEERSAGSALRLRGGWLARSGASVALSPVFTTAAAILAHSPPSQPMSMPTRHAESDDLGHALLSASLCASASMGGIYMATRLPVSRRISIAALPMLIPLRAVAYDSLPTAAAPDPAAVAAEREKRKLERLARAAKKNAEVDKLLESVIAAKASKDFVAGMDALSVWIIGQGAPLCSGACQWTTAEDLSALPGGFRTRELVATCKAALMSLPRVTYGCEATRDNNGICISAGAEAEGAYQAFLVELKKRAPKQYETPTGPVSF